MEFLFTVVIGGKSERRQTTKGGKKMKRSIKFQLVAVLLCSAVLLSCSDLFENRVPMQSSSSSLVKLVVPAVEIEKLDAPRQIFV